jgi:hypothetical protein
MLAFQTKGFTLRNRAPNHKQDKKKQFVSATTEGSEQCFTTM